MAAPFAPVGSGMPSTRVELRISCKKLRDTDVLSKSDPMVVLYSMDARKGSGWVEVSS